MDMITKLTNIPAYFINPDDFNHRLIPAMTALESCGFASIERIPFNEKYPARHVTMTKAHLYALDTAMKKGQYPFALFEDDIAIMKHPPLEFNLPDEADLVYWGGSTYYSFQTQMWHFEPYNDAYYRIFNILSAHAILIPNKRGAEIITGAYIQSLKENIFNDVMLAKYSNMHIFLAPKDGNYFYQDDYTKDVTFFKWTNIPINGSKFLHNEA